VGGERGQELLQTNTRELPLTAVAGGAAVLAGVTLWQLGIEFERAWIRSYDSPLLGETGVDELHGSPQRSQISQMSPIRAQRRRWVASHDAYRAARTPQHTRTRG
jgi:hypothetical protein